MKDPVGESLSLLARMSRLKVQALVLKERAREARLRLQKSINTKAGASTPAKKEVLP